MIITGYAVEDFDAVTRQVFKYAISQFLYCDPDDITLTISKAGRLLNVLLPSQTGQNWPPRQV